MSEGKLTAHSHAKNRAGRLEVRAVVAPDRARLANRIDAFGVCRHLLERSPARLDACGVLRVYFGLGFRNGSGSNSSFVGVDCSGLLVSGLGS